jgi:hypothetical protein
MGINLGNLFRGASQGFAANHQLELAERLQREAEERKFGRDKELLKFDTDEAIRKALATVQSEGGEAVDLVGQRALDASNRRVVDAGTAVGVDVTQFMKPDGTFDLPAIRSETAKRVRAKNAPKPDKPDKPKEGQIIESGGERFLVDQITGEVKKLDIPAEEGGGQNLPTGSKVETLSDQAARTRLKGSVLRGLERPGNEEAKRQIQEILLTNEWNLEDLFRPENADILFSMFPSLRQSFAFTKDIEKRRLNGELTESEAAAILGGQVDPVLQEKAMSLETGESTDDRLQGLTSRVLARAQGG